MAANTVTCKGIQDTISWCEGSVELGGMRRSVYYAAGSDIVSMPTVQLDTKFRPTSSTATGTFVMAADCVFQRIDILPDKSRFLSDAQGEIPSQSQLNKLTLYHPSVSPEATAACCYINNAACIFVFQDTAGRWRICGNKNLPIKNSVTQDGGEGPTGSPNTTISVEATDYVAFPYFNGKIDTVDGELDCSSGTIAPAA